jgi:hypothetical protein
MASEVLLEELEVLESIYPTELSSLFIIVHPAIGSEELKTGAKRYPNKTSRSTSSQMIHQTVLSQVCPQTTYSSLLRSDCEMG